METEIPSSKKSLVLAGGGMRVAYQAGVVLALEESGLRFDHVDGTSGGIFNTAMLASGVRPNEIAGKWRTLKLSGFVSFTRVGNYLNPFRVNGFADADGIKNKVFPHLGIDVSRINGNRELQTSFNVCNFKEKSVESIPGASVKQEHLLAGVSLPIFMPALRIAGTWYTDAVWIKDANLLEAVKQGAKDIWLVWAIGNTPTFLQGSFPQYVHMIEMSANGGLLEEYKQIELIKQLRKLEGKASPIRVFVIKSRVPLPLDPDFFFNKINARELINMGYAQAKDYLKSLPAEGEFLDESLTKNQEPDYILSFRSCFAGRIKKDQTSVDIGLYLYFRFCEFEDGDLLEIYSSLENRTDGGEQPCFAQTFSKVNLDSKTRLLIKGKVNWQGEIVDFEAVTTMTNPVELLLGLNFKQLNFEIKRENDKLIGKGTLTQNVVERIKAIFYLQVKSIFPRRTGIKKKIKLVEKFIAHEV
jgi:predicted acylesterase/phospholipase RssA